MTHPSGGTHTSTHPGAVSAALTPVRSGVLREVRTSAGAGALDCQDKGDESEEHAPPSGMALYAANEAGLAGDGGYRESCDKCAAVIGKAVIERPV